MADVAGAGGASVGRSGGVLGGNVFGGSREGGAGTGVTVAIGNTLVGLGQSSGQVHGFSHGESHTLLPHVGGVGTSSGMRRVFVARGWGVIVAGGNTLHAAIRNARATKMTSRFICLLNVGQI